MYWTKIFLIAAGFSAVGALPIGMINLSVAERTIKKGILAGVMVAIGATIIEFTYTFLALYFIDFFLKNEVVGQAIKTIAIFIFIALALFYWFRKYKPVAEMKSGRYSKSRNFGLGMGIAALNMLILPYWIFLGLWFKSNQIRFATASDILFMSLGSALGALFVFLLYVRLGGFIVGKISKVSYYTNKTLAVLFFSLAVVQVIRIAYGY